MSEPLYTLHTGDCLEVLRTLPDCSVDAVVTDPPAGIGFMTGNNGWDGNKGGRDQWVNWLAEVMVEVKRVLKHGGHALVWSLPRVQHNTARACEDAGFEIRDVVSYLHDAGTDWQNFLESLSPEQLQGFEIALASQVDTGFDQILACFGQGFPKGQNISLAIEGVLGTQAQGFSFAGDDGRKAELKQTRLESRPKLTKAEAAQWEGWKSHLKPSYEPWILLRKPVEKGLTIAENVLKHGVGGLNVGACAVEIDKENEPRKQWEESRVVNQKEYTIKHETINANFISGNEKRTPGMGWIERVENGRYPANLIVDGSDAVEAIFPDTGQNGGGRKGENGKRYYMKTKSDVAGFSAESQNENLIYDPERNDWFTLTPKSPEDGGGSASRYFYHAKVSPTDRNEGCENLPNRHATVKSNNLMKYLCRLITPPNGVILDCFMGSGSTGKAAMQEGFRFIGIEQNPEYVAIAEARILHAIQTTGLTPEKAAALTLSNPTGLAKDLPLKLF